ncbi:MAG: ABC transporter ATP-binding protein [Candidatus Sphingomonas phytovorans]|nr:ABC transporter ATP-binding protein [Sphingomonas sp.]WEK02475.1 MAG: ABC transporter ATP-binding protein [Sphingomonas sp.]
MRSWERAWGDIGRLAHLVRTLQQGRSLWSLAVLPVLMAVRGLLEAVSLSVLVLLVVAAANTEMNTSQSRLPALTGWLVTMPVSHRLTALGVLIVALMIVKNALHWTIARMRSRFARGWLGALARQLYSRHLAEAMDRRADHDPVAGSIRATDSAVRVVNTYLLAVADGLGETCVVAALLALFAWVAGPWPLLAMAVPAVLIWLSHRLLTRNASFYSRLRLDRIAALQRWMRDSSATSREIGLYRSGDAFGKRYAELAKGLATALDRQNQSQELMLPMAETAGVIGLLLLVAVELLSGHVEPARLMTGLAVSVRLLPSLRRLASVLHTRSFFQSDLDTVMAALAVSTPTPAPLATADHGPIVTLSNISYSHSARDETHTAPQQLDSVDLTLSPSVWTALTGRSGTGKSTLVDILLGRIVPDTGETSWAGGTRDGTGYAASPVTLIDTTLRDNIAFPDSTVWDESALRQALAIAQADEIVARLPMGLDQPMLAVVDTLSQGERQRIGLARAILRADRLLILDEATAALDLDVERRLFEALRQARPMLAVLLVTHRPATAAHADRILLLADGRLSEQAALWRVNETIP